MFRVGVGTGRQNSTSRRLAVFRSAFAMEGLPCLKVTQGGNYSGVHRRRNEFDTTDGAEYDSGHIQSGA